MPDITHWVASLKQITPCHETNSVSKRFCMVKSNLSNFEIITSKENSYQIAFESIASRREWSVEELCIGFSMVLVQKSIKNVQKYM